MNKKSIWDYFEIQEDYPQEVVHNILPYGTIWCYISNTFLNGLVNYAKPIKCYILERHSDNNKQVRISSISPKLKYSGTKNELINKINSFELKFHEASLRIFNDDVIILSEIPTTLNDDINRYIFFWFDYEVSDCCIGKFETNDSEEDVKETLYNWLESCRVENKGIINYKELNVDFLKNSIQF